MIDDTQYQILNTTIQKTTPSTETIQKFSISASKITTPRKLGPRPAVHIATETLPTQIPALTHSVLFSANTKRQMFTHPFLVQIQAAHTARPAVEQIKKKKCWRRFDKSSKITLRANHPLRLFGHSRRISNSPII